MSDIAEKLARGPTPLAIDGRLRARVTEAVLAQAGIRHKELNAFLRDRLGGLDVSRGALFAEPTICLTSTPQTCIAHRSRRHPRQ